MSSILRRAEARARALQTAHGTTQSYNEGNSLVTSASFLWEVSGASSGPVPAGEP